MNGTRKGKGIMRWKNEHIYFGDWQKDNFHGKGVYIFPSWERFEGDLINGKK